MASPSTAAHDHSYTTVVMLDADNPLSTAGQEEDEVDDDANKTIGSEDVTIGVVKASIVGIRYYAGVVSDGERVCLVREPTNPHDRNAIRVDNCVGEQIGHIRRQQAKALSELIDKDRIRVDAMVARGSNNEFSIPATVVVYGHVDYVEKITNELKRLGISVYNVPKKISDPKPPPQLMDALFDANGMKEELEGKLMSASEVISTTLYPHQMMALHWMTYRENGLSLPPFWIGEKGDTYKNLVTNTLVNERPPCALGGILADDMGLGKTLTMISLIFTNFYDGRPLLKATPGFVRNSEKKPVEGEIAKSEEPEPTQDGEDRRTRLAKSRKRQIDKLDNVEAVPLVPLKMVKTENDTQLVDTSIPVSVEIPSPSSLEPAELRGRRRPTLIVCPMSLLSHWVQQVDDHTGNDVDYKLHVHYGSERTNTLFSLEDCDIVVTTYGTLLSEYTNSLKRSPAIMHQLMRVKWLRVVLDEGHQIKNSAAKTTAAVNSLDTERRWILSGTPIQNNLKELYSLINWLGVKPFSLQPKAYWNREISNPVKKGDPLAMRVLQVLINGICLRRTKRDKFNGLPIVALPPKNINIVEVDLDQGERSEYQKLAAEGRKIIAEMVKKKSYDNYAFLLTVILRLRQFCCHPWLVPEEVRKSLLSVEGDNGNNNDVLGGMELECDTCGKLLDPNVGPGPVLAPCRHIFCENCISNEDRACPSCKAGIEKDSLLYGAVNRSGDNKDQSTEIPDKILSSKMTAAIEEIQRIRREHSGDKLIVVSQFTSFLSALEPHLDSRGVAFMRLDGTMNSMARTKVIGTFSQSDSPIPVLLLSLKAGGVGLNLVSANHMLVLEPTWNPSVEDQCFDRIHRMGQKKPVNIYRFVTNGTIEEKVVELQEKKRNLACGAFGGDVTEGATSAKGKKKAKEVLRRERIKDFQTLVSV